MSSLIKMACVDFNSDALGQPATPGLYAAAQAQDQVRWCRELGANAIQTFCVALNGYAWYRSDVAPVTPGMDGDFLHRMIDLGHREGMEVHGYFCLASNAWFRSRNRDRLTTHIDWRKNVPLTTEYLDYFCRMAEEALLRNELDGVLIDWFEEIVPLWTEAEKQTYEEVMDRPFPKEVCGPPKPFPGVDTGLAMIPRWLSDEDEIAFRRAATERAWKRIHEAMKSARPSCRIWLNVPFHAPAEPIWEKSPILREVDMMLTERCDLRIARWLQEETNSKPVLVNLGGLGRYAVDSWQELVDAGCHLYTYGKPELATMLPDLESNSRLSHVRTAMREARLR